MLFHLTIQNYALIKHLDIDFSKGFTVITGETGAGKSILLGALNLILGKRADTRVLMDTNKKCIVEGTFSIEQYNLQSFFNDNNLDFETTTILRREINTSGKSRAFINDTPVSLTTLKFLGEQLIDIHSQDQTGSLTDSGFQFNVVDSYAGLIKEVKDYQQIFTQFTGLQKTLNGLLEAERKSAAEKDYLDFVFHELEESDLKENEQQELENDLKVTQHAEDIKSRLFNSV